MRKKLKTSVAILALAGGLLASPALLAHDSGASHGSPTGPGMMDQGGMMKMMGRMSKMMESCDKMMEDTMRQHDGQPVKPDPTPNRKK